MSVEYLWQADGPLQGDRGVCGDLESATVAAENCLQGGASSAVIREATPERGVGALDDGWHPTGDAWLAEFAPSGAITGKPVTKKPGG